MRRLSRTLAALALACAAVPALAQQPPAVDPGAMAALQGMGAYLRTLKTFQVEVATTDEDVLDDGQKIQYSGTTSILARMPNGLRAEVANDRHERMYLYDGKTFTLFAKRLNYYATVPAPPTVGQLADTLDEKYDVTVPARRPLPLGGAELEHGRDQGRDGRRRRAPSGARPASSTRSGRRTSTGRSGSRRATTRCPAGS